MSERNIKFQRKFSSTRMKQSKPKKGLFLVLILVVVLILWFKADAIMDYFFKA